MKNATLRFLLLFPCLAQALVENPKPSILLWEIVEYGGELGYEMENQNGNEKTVWNYHVKTGYDLTFQIVGLNLGDSLDGTVRRIAATSNECFEESISFTATKLGAADRFLIFHLKFNGKNKQKIQQMKYNNIPIGSWLCNLQSAQYEIDFFDNTQTDEPVNRKLYVHIGFVLWLRWTIIAICSLLSVLLSAAFSQWEKGKSWFSTLKKNNHLNNNNFVL